MSDRYAVGGGCLEKLLASGRAQRTSVHSQPRVPVREGALQALPSLKLAINSLFLAPSSSNGPLLWSSGEEITHSPGKGRHGRPILEKLVEVLAPGLKRELGGFEQRTFGLPILGRLEGALASSSAT